MWLFICCFGSNILIAFICFVAFRCQFARKWCSFFFGPRVVAHVSACMTILPEWKEEIKDKLQTLKGTNTLVIWRWCYDDVYCCCCSSVMAENNFYYGFYIAFFCPVLISQSIYAIKFTSQCSFSVIIWKWRHFNLHSRLFISCVLINSFLYTVTKSIKIIVFLLLGLLQNIEQTLYNCEELDFLVYDTTDL